jgi:hypothetical protein
MKQNYDELEMEVISFDTEDIICASDHRDENETYMNSEF